MKKWIQRTVCLLLAVLTLVSLLPAMGAVMEAEATDASQTVTIANVAAKDKSPASYTPAKTYADVTAIVKDYLKVVGDKAYWNAGIRRELTGSDSTTALKTMAFVKTITSSPCETSGFNGSYNGCTSNGFNGVCTVDANAPSKTAPFKRNTDYQCSGFAAYMSYVVFKSTNNADFTLYYGTGDRGLNKTSDNTIHPGDIMRYDGHSYFIYDVVGDTAITIECNLSSARCKIYERNRKVSDIKTALEKCNGTTGGLFRNNQLKASTQSYNIKFDANKPSGAANPTGTMAEQQAWVGAAVQLTANAYAIENYIFQGWNTQKNGKGTSYSDKASVSDLTTQDGATVTLYAQWMSRKAYDYLNQSTRYASSLRAEAVAGSVLQNIKTLPCSWATSTESKTVRALKKGEMLTVTELRKNSAGNYWYKVKADSDGAEGYVFQEYLKAWSENNVSFNVKLAKYSINKGSGCEISGSVSSKYDLASLKGVLDDSDPNTKEQKQTITSGYTKIQSTKLDDDLGFGKLSRGKGTLTLTAEMKNNYWYDAGTKTHVHVTETKVIDFVVVGQYDVKFNANTTDSVGNMPATQKKKDGTNLTLSSAIPTRSGYTFKGWSTNKNATKETYKAGATLSEDTAAGDLTFYAVWAKNAFNTYSITYNANGGSNAPEAQTKQKNKDLTLSTVTPTRMGYTFDKWSDGKNTYGAGGTYTKNEDAELVAQWKPIEYTICYFANGGSGTMAGTAAVYDKNATLSENKFTRSGYEFVGWNTKDDGSGTMYQPGDQVKNLVDKYGTDKIIYAIWEEIPDHSTKYLTAEQYMAKCSAYFSQGALKITASGSWFKALPCSEGTCKASANVYDLAVPQGTEMTVTGLYKNTEGNYWYKATWNGKTGYIYAAQASFTAAAADFTISGESKPGTLKKGAGFGIKGTVTSKMGTPFKITGTISDSGGQKDTQTVTSSSASYSLATKEFDSNISFGKLSSGSCQYTVKASITCCYSSNGTKLESKELSKTLIDHTFLVAGDHTLTFVSGHDDNKTVKTLTVQDMGTFTIADVGYQRDGYKFLGYTVKRLKDGKIFGGGAWRTEKELADSGKEPQLYVVGRSLTLDDSWTTGGVADSNYTFTGVWEALPTYTVAYNANGGSGAPATQTKISGKTLTLSNAVPVRTGYTFLGWAESATAATATYQKGGSFTKNQNVTLYAVWKAEGNSAYLVDNLSGNSWILKNGQVVEAENADTSNLSRVRVTFTLSEKLRRKYPDVASWARNNSVSVTEHQIPLQMENLTLDFLTADGQFDLVIQSRDSYVARYTCPIRVNGDTQIQLDLYELILNFNGGKLQVGNVQKAQVTSYYIYENYNSFAHVFGKLPSRDGYTLAGWDTDPAALRPDYDPEFYEHLFFREDLELYAVWQDEAAVNTIYLVDNNGAAPVCWAIREDGITKADMVDVSRLNHVVLKLNPSAAIRSRYPDLNQLPEIQNGVDVNGQLHLDFVDQKLNFYVSDSELNYLFPTLGAQWLEIREDREISLDLCQVRLDYNGGGSGIYHHTVPGIQRSFEGKPRREGYTLLGWAATADATAAVYKPKFVASFDADTVLYAVWKKNAQVLTYASSLPATNIPAARNFETGKALTLSTAVPTSDGYLFKGWSTDADGNGAMYQPGDTVTFDASVTLWAQWELAPIQVYDANADKYWQIDRSNYQVTVVPSLDIRNLAHITITLNPSEAVRNNYAPIQNWYSNYDFCIGPLGPGEGYFQISGNKFDFYVSKGTYDHCRNGANGASRFDFQNSADLTFNIYQLTLDASYEGHSDVSTWLFIGNYPYSGAMAAYPERDGYTLAGWSGSPNAATAEYPPTFPWKFSADTTLYAVWTANS